MNYIIVKYSPVPFASRRYPMNLSARRIYLRMYMAILSSAVTVLSGEITTPDNGGWVAAGQSQGVTSVMRYYTFAPEYAEVAKIIPAGDDGYIVAGAFTSAGGEWVDNIALWDGDQWNPLGGGIDGTVYDMTTGNEGLLFVCGQFITPDASGPSNLAVWDGASWSMVDSGGDGEFYACAADGAGNIFVGGRFTVAGGTAANNIAKWDGKTWSPLGNGTDALVEALAFDVEGNLYAGGWFDSAGAVAAKYVARWNGSEWSALGSGIRGSGVYVNMLHVDAESMVYAGGSNTGVQKWDGTGWSSLGTEWIGSVYMLSADPAGHIYTCAKLTNTTYHILRWKGQEWEVVDSVDGTVNCMVFKDDTTACCGGMFSTIGQCTADGVALWSNHRFSPVGSSFGKGLNGSVSRFAADGAGNVFMTGKQTTSGIQPLSPVAKWTGGGWMSHFPVLDEYSHIKIASLVTDNTGNLTINAVCAKPFTFSDNRIISWDGAAWNDRSMGIYGSAVRVRCLATDNDGNLIAGGYFSSAGDENMNSIALWDGTSWKSLGSGVSGGPADPVLALAVDENNTVFVGGGFDSAGGVPARNIARWDGTAWSALGDGVDDRVYALGRDSRGTLFAAGGFRNTGDTPVNHIASWSGTAWLPLGKGLRIRPYDGFIMAFDARPDLIKRCAVNAVAFDKNGGLYAGGCFDSAGTVAADNIAKWDGERWWPLGSGVDGTVTALAVDKDDYLHVGGDFQNAGGATSPHYARYNLKEMSVDPRKRRTSSTVLSISRRAGTAVLEISLREPTVVTCALVSLSGRIICRWNRRFSSGMHAVPVMRKSPADGLYIVKVAAGGEVRHFKLPVGNNSNRRLQ